MTPSDLYTLFRLDTTDTVADYLWSDTEVWSYMDEAYSMFVRLTGGIPDTSSALVSIPVVAGQPYAPIDSRILKIRYARLGSNNRPLGLANIEDTPLNRVGDYGAATFNNADFSQGNVHTMVVGEEEGLVRWINVPAANDMVKLTVYRLPLNTISEDSQDTDLNEIHHRHHRSLLLWMKHLAYAKQDTETFNKVKSDEMKGDFEAYCAQAKAEIERQKSKPRIVRYGGL